MLEPCDQLLHVAAERTKGHDPQRQVGRVVKRCVTKIGGCGSGRITLGCA
jgi:hypothetical protein